VGQLMLTRAMLQMIREKKLERRRQRRKAAEHQLQDQEAEMIVSPAHVEDQQQEPVSSTAAKQHAPPADVDRVRRRRRRRRPKPSADDENVEKYQNGWAAVRSEPERLAGALNSTDLLASRSEPNTLSPDAPSLTPHPLVYNSVSTPLANKDLLVQPAFVQKLTDDLDMEPTPYYPPLQSNVALFHLFSEINIFSLVVSVIEKFNNSF